jgi:hypothetical protein
VDKGTDTSFGAVQEKSCGIGEELVYCSTSGLCMTGDESRKIGWRTCRSCSFTETTRADGAGVCKECADVCRTRFHYSPACGQQETDLTKIWVVYNGLLQQYKTLSPAQKQQESYVQHGPCQMCQPCVKGEYNDKCNVHMSGVNPVGSCQTCLTKCAQGFFMYHSEKEAGCHAPPEMHQSANKTICGKSMRTTFARDVQHGFASRTKYTS